MWFASFLMICPYVKGYFTFNIQTHQIKKKETFIKYSYKWNQLLLLLITIVSK